MNNNQQKSALSPGLTKTASLTTDIEVLLIKSFVLIILFLLTDTTNFLIFIILIFILGLLFSSTFRDIYSIYYFFKAKQFANGYYLRNSKPECPFLLVTPSGFRCAIEFNRKFDLTVDFPKCHNEILFKEHWNEKVPGLLQQAKQESNIIKLRSYLSALASIRASEAADLFLNIVENQNYGLIHQWIAEITIKTTEISEKKLKKLIHSKFAEKTIESPNLSKIDFDNLFSQAIGQYINLGVIKRHESEESNLIYDSMQVTKANSILKARSNPIIRQIALIGLASIKEPKTVPLIIGMLGRDHSQDKILVKVLASIGDIAVNDLKSLLTTDGVDVEKQYAVIEALGLMGEHTELYDFLHQKWETVEATDDLMGAYLLSSMGQLDAKRALEIAIKVVKTKKTEDLLFNAAKKMLIQYASQTLPVLIDILGELPPDTLLEEQENLRINIVIVIEDMDIESLRKWFMTLSTEKKNNILELMNREGLEKIATRLSKR